MKIAKVLVIAGSDSCGGAGIQADIKAIAFNHVHPSTIITCLTAQNTSQVSAILETPLNFIQQQFDALNQDIEFNAVKIGMLSSLEIAELVYKNLLKFVEQKIPIILDPVMIATSKDRLLKDNAIEFLKNKLSSLSTIITPNIDEAEILSEMKIKNIHDMIEAGKKIRQLNSKSVLIKGGHLEVNLEGDLARSLEVNLLSDLKENFSENLDKKSENSSKNSKNFIENSLPNQDFDHHKIYNILIDQADQVHIITNDRLDLGNIHGTGCSLASAISANIAKQINIVDACKLANQFVFQAILNSQKIGKGSLVLGY
jgi:hydroxymethylpyrimidine kinase/phosphomethylpyrimidine kinase